jgi:hypothetical protein
MVASEARKKKNTQTTARPADLSRDEDGKIESRNDKRDSTWNSRTTRHEEFFLWWYPSLLSKLNAARYD